LDKGLGAWWKHPVVADVILRMWRSCVSVWFRVVRPHQLSTCLGKHFSPSLVLYMLEDWRFRVQHVS